MIAPSSRIQLRNEKPLFVQRIGPSTEAAVVHHMLLVYQGRPVSLQLWDVAGSQLHAQPCHHALIGQRADGVLYVLDVTSRDSLQAVDDWDRALSKVKTMYSRS